ncbi:MAG: hypothetical protein OEW15_14300 [Nitrospirota bacterium]|nr:hypothetical protein [Nitrospirota bacterium]
MNQLKFTPKSPSKEAFPTGQVCPLPGKGSIGSAKGAMGSAVVTIIL